MTQNCQTLAARLLFVFVNLGVGTSQIIQTPTVAPPTREFLEAVPGPFWLFGVVFCLIGSVLLVATLKDNAYLLFRTLVAAAVFWFLFSLGYLAPVFLDPLHTLWSGFVIFAFVGGIHLSGALVEAHK